MYSRYGQIRIIVNEILNNAIKYHSHIYQCKIDIAFTILTEEKKAILNISDNGAGISEDELSKTQGLGLKLIKQFSSKLPNSQTKFVSKDGTTFILSFST